MKNSLATTTAFEPIIAIKGRIEKKLSRRGGGYQSLDKILIFNDLFFEKREK
jgi:hypothetical protein